MVWLDFKEMKRWCSGWLGLGHQGAGISWTSISTDAQVSCSSPVGQLTNCGLVQGSLHSYGTENHGKQWEITELHR